MVRIKPVPREHAEVRHDGDRLIFAALREAPSPMTTRKLMRAVMKPHGISTADHALVRAAVGHMASTLRKLKSRGKLVADKQDGGNQQWGWLYKQCF